MKQQHHHRFRCPAMTGLCLLTLAGVVGLSGCGRPETKGGATQTAAKVNKQEITVHQINYFLQRQRNLNPEKVEEAGRTVLERLIEQELAVQKAEDGKLDRDPNVMQQVEAARREVLARAYLDKVSDAVPKPTEKEIEAYFESKPALFKERRIYQFEELAIEASPEQVGALRDRLAAAKQSGEFLDFLKSGGYRYLANKATRAAEQLPLNRLDELARLRDGQAMFSPTGKGAQVLILAGSQSQPVSLAQAKPVIEQFLLNERRRAAMQKHVEELRAGAHVQYVGKYAEQASSPRPGEPAAAASAAPLAPAAAPTAASGLDASTITKGLGLK